MNLLKGCGRNGGQTPLIPSFPRGPVSLAGCLWKKGVGEKGELGSVPATLETHVVWGGGCSQFLLGSQGNQGTCSQKPQGHWWVPALSTRQ